MARFENYPKVNGLPVPKFITQSQVDLIGGMEAFTDDIWIVTYPKSGTTWMQQIVKLILNNGENDERTLSQAVPWLEAANNPDPSFDYNQIDISNMSRPRAFKSHFPFHLMPCGKPNEIPNKFIYIARNPKDVAVSYYYHQIGYQYLSDLTWDDHFEGFLDGKLPFGDYFEHVLGWWAHKDDDNVLFIKYEDLKKNLHTSVQLVSNFLSMQLTKDVVKKIADQSTFEAMKHHPGANYGWASHRRHPGAAPFMRKGVVGDWKSHFSLEQSSKLDDEYVRKFVPVGLKFDFQ